MKRNPSKATLSRGQIWNFSGTIVLILGPSKSRMARCLVLWDDDPCARAVGEVSDWTDKWFDHPCGKRIA